jgi:hypothetical protein
MGTDMLWRKEADQAMRTSRQTQTMQAPSKITETQLSRVRIA